MSCTVGGSGYCPQVTYYSSTNHINKIGSASAAYAAAGELTSDGTHTYQWDAENRLISVDNGSTASYLYNALGERVRKEVGTEILDSQYDIQGEPVAYGNTVPSFVTWQDFLYAGGRFVSFYGSGTRFVHSNILGPSTVLTNQTGAETQDELYYPWGQRWEMQGTVDDERFAGLQRRDAETGLDPTLYRMYESNYGRWMTPDPLGGDITNPQSLNRYAYVLNNPATLNDPLGLQPGESGGGVSCRDPQYAESHAECQGPGSPWCFEDAITGSPCWTGTLGFSGGGGPVGGSGTAASAASAPPAGQPPLAGMGEENVFGCPFPYNSMGLCGLEPNYWAGQIGASVNFTLPWWGLTGTYYFGLAFDLRGNIAAYYGGGLGQGVGASGSAGVQVGDSSGYTVCGLRGPFGQVSGTAGADAGGTIEVFQGKGNGPGGVVRGGTVTLGPTEGASLSIQGTATGVIPFHGHCGNGGLQ